MRAAAVVVLCAVQFVDVLGVTWATTAIPAVLAGLGLDAHAVSTASECISVVRRLRPQLIVMEGRLPDGDGWELARLLKAMASTAQIKVIAVGEEGAQPEIERAFLAGCEAFLAKPVRPDALVVQIHRLLGPQPSTPPPVAAL